MSKEKNIEHRKIDELDERSDQVKEILGQAPNWLISWGISVILISLLLLLIGASYISYNDIVAGQVAITSKNPPAYIDAKMSGKLTHVFVKANNPVKKDDVMAVIESTANYKDVVFIKEKIINFSPNFSDFDSIKTKFPSDVKIGNIQSTYNQFRFQYQEYLNYNKFNPEKNTLFNLNLQIKTRRNSLKNSRNQLKQYKTELVNAENLFDKQKKLYDKKIISENEYLQQENIYSTAKRNYEAIESGMRGDENAILLLQNSIKQAQIGDKSAAFLTDQKLEESRQNLENKIRQWEQQFVIKSPINGTVTLFDVWNSYQNVKVGDVLFTVVPNDINDIIGRVNIPTRNSGKVKIGQSVIIKLDNYPYQEWGSLNGIIKTISEVPKQGEGSYTIFIDLKNLNTSFNKTIDFKQEMQGTAEIVVEELTILERIFYQLREVFNRN